LIKSKKYWLSIFILTIMFYVNVQDVYSGHDPSEVTRDSGSLTVLNLGGAVDIPADGRHWNFHSFGFEGDVDWRVDIGEKVEVSLKTEKGDSGHIAVGTWWNNGFTEKTKIPLYNHEIRVEFDVKINKFEYLEPGEWLRVALACAVQRSDGTVVYTELDFIDSPNTLKHPHGDIASGGDVVYRGGNVVEFMVDEMPLGVWRHFSLRITDYIEKAWLISEGDVLESVYLVIETDDNPVQVELELDNLWLYSLKQTYY
jgi:hypothetical protein